MGVGAGLYVYDVS